ncbi:MAG: retinol dehydrogenase, partial [Planctomycetota bacterium]|nr:retinol dehydrogenase [Planctomycetota bacterium]
MPDRLAIGVITNPHSRKNRGRHARAGALQALLAGRGLVRETHSTEEIGAVLDEFRASGVSYWVTDGGDGSL